MSTRDPERAVQGQYEAYPYPARDPADEARRLVTGSPSHPLEIDHYIFAGRRDWTKPFRALIAGGGTGDAAIMLAQGMKDRGCPAEITYLDLSAAARQIATARAARRGLDNIDFRTGSLLDAAALGRFDYIDCCGVLHHLADPPAGLAALVAALEDEGGIGLMLYGELGRTGVYPVQAMLRALGGDMTDREKLGLARRLLMDLPASNWLSRNPHLSDHLANDAGLYDLLLHSRDRAYRVAELLALIEGAGLRLVSFIEPARYEPASYLRDPALRRLAGALEAPDRAAFAENLCGSLKNHILYAVKTTRRDDTLARPTGPEVVPVLRDLDGPRLAKGVGAGGMLDAEFGGIRVSFALPPLAGAILARCDGARCLEAIRADLPSRPDWSAFKSQFDTLYAAMNGVNRMLLRCPARAERR
ncbi:MAG: class I SAM-dependent methyltransferase [Alphaproteobacteria bacterium]|nr:class I SAM-dependent methyltransferase [Alphaproteobacteria bacterium]